ncbi:acyl-acyl carrier protein thioesterase [Ligilactobacillus acidipiscis DSM 15836]|jgi:medium-chain acyl-[acyl-carrier-protein] hydrolase|uniref:Acyl-acyl carrier protein thioesterase n=1 Tax=Ligilactobacillus acidipiscis DSM 15836 TaxID=1423716 RepID=A0ABR5PLI5_9LACO|nr:acyl-ACP thioesterase domain-containing protein [Ligilactobacillus acidipiscis]KRM28769.1 acyl-acyl carrier protein thioesterase [Ligilactobacillus acidipiscis DSM 15836]GAW64069.1 acyl-ACP thioesterase [Ligilactobacillus acidipiscis]GEN21074.1 acyl-ACP thioesterase [Ligilactobacillus acidipiscis]
MSAKKFSEDHRVVYYETDVTGSLGIGRLVDLMMLSSEDQSDKLGITNEKVGERGLGWVVTQHIINIKRLPKVDEIITLSTQAKSYNRFFCYRDFAVYDQAGNELVTMHSVFVLMDRSKRKMVRLPEDIITPYESEYTKKIERLPMPLTVENASGQKNYRVRFMDIDANHHVNNVHYFDWMLDALPAEFLLSHRLIKMNIAYRQEVYYGDQVNSAVEIDEDNLLTRHTIMTGEQQNCLAECEWAEIK